MTAQQQKHEHLYLVRIYESNLSKLDSEYGDKLDRQKDSNTPSYLQLLQYGTILAKGKSYMNPGQKYLRRLDRFYSNQINDIDVCQNDSTGFINLHILRFLTAYSQLNPTLTEKVKNRIYIFLNNLDTKTDKTSEANSFPDNHGGLMLPYEHLTTLTDIYIAFQDASSYSILHRYCSKLFQHLEYPHLCKSHCYMGVFAAMNYTKFKAISKDILLQNLFRINNLRSALTKDPWPFFEQIFISLYFLPDQTLFNFARTLFIRRIEEFYFATRFFSDDIILPEVIQMTQVLCYYMKCNDNNRQVSPSGSSKTDNLTWRKTDAATSITNGKLCHPESTNKDYSQLTFVSNQILPDTLFVAPDKNWSKKYQTRTHDHIKPFNLGAETVITSIQPEKIRENQQFILVNNTFTALVKLAMSNRDKYKGQVIGITGSVGKTSTTAMLHDILNFFGKAHKNIPFFNHQAGIPKSVANIPLDSNFAILEMGMGRPLSILPKTKLVRPHIGIVIEIQPDHMEFHDSIQSIVKTKMDIIEGLEPGGTVILNRDSCHFPTMSGIAKMKKVANIITFGEHPHADIRARSIKLSPVSSHIELELYGKRIEYNLSLPGMHMARNSLAAWAALYALKIEPERAVAAFARLKPVSRRNEISNIQLTNGITIQIIDDSFNANPSSMRSSFHLLSLLQPKDHGRRIMVMGDMGELGNNSRKYHEDLAGDINQSKIDIVFSIGKHTQYLCGKIDKSIIHKHFNSFSDLQNHLLKSLKNNDVIAVKGSAREQKMETIIENLKSYHA